MHFYSECVWGQKSLSINIWHGQTKIWQKQVEQVLARTDEGREAHLQLQTRKDDLVERVSLKWFGDFLNVWWLLHSLCSLPSVSAEVKDTLRIGRAWIRGPFQRQNYFKDKKLFFVLLCYILLTTSKLLLLLFHLEAYLLSMIFLFKEGFESTSPCKWGNSKGHRSGTVKARRSTLNPDLPRWIYCRILKVMVRLKLGNSNLFPIFANQIILEPGNEKKIISSDVQKRYEL